MNTVARLHQWVKTQPNSGTLAFILQGERNGPNRPTAVDLLTRALETAKKERR